MDLCQNPAAVCAKTEKTGIFVIALAGIRADILFFNVQKDVDQGTADPGMGQFFGRDPVTELFILKKSRKLPHDSVGKIRAEILKLFQLPCAVVQKS